MSGAAKDLIAPDIDVKKRGLLERISRLSPWRFVLVMSIVKILSHFFHFLILLLLSTYYHALPKGDRLGLAYFFVYAVLVGPWIETVVGQGLPMAFTNWRSKPTTYLILATVWFSHLHAMGKHGSDYWLPMLSHLVGAFLLACVFLHGRKHGWWRAIWMTSIVHSVSNLPLLICLICVRS